MSLTPLKQIGYVAASVALCGAFYTSIQQNVSRDDSEYVADQMNKNPSLCKGQDGDKKGQFQISVPATADVNSWRVFGNKVTKLAGYCSIQEDTVQRNIYAEPTIETREAKPASAVRNSLIMAYKTYPAPGA